MPKDITYVQSLELYEIALKLKERYYLHLGHVDLDIIYFAEKLGDKPKFRGKSPHEISLNNTQITEFFRVQLK